MHEHLSVKSSMLLHTATIRIRLVALLFILHGSSKHVLDKCKSLCILVTFASPRLRFAHQLCQANRMHAALQTPMPTFQTSPSTSSIQRTPIQPSGDTTCDS